MEDTKILDLLIEDLNTRAKLHGICAHNDIKKELQQLVRVAQALALSSPLVVTKQF